MKIVVRPHNEDDEQLTIEVKRVYTRGCVNDYGLKSKEYNYFQFDGSDRPSDFKDEYREDVWFRGYLIGKKKDGKNPIIECEIQVKEINK